LQVSGGGDGGGLDVDVAGVIKTVQNHFFIIAIEHHSGEAGHRIDAVNQFAHAVVGGEVDRGNDC
jgi:hypothetical protein